MKAVSDEVGLKCGLEIHQQVQGSKLFCRCPTKITERADFSLRRVLRSVSGEQDEVDAAARAEAARERVFTYSGSREHNCLVDLDESPPLGMSEEALRTVLLVAKMLGARPMDVVQVMRKIIVDGSTTSGFQRTGLIATGGVLESSQGPVRIATVIAEEDSAQKRRDTDKGVEYNLDRLGIPLVEIATDPDIVSAEHAQEVAQMLGMVLRSTGLVRRGQGTIRQDVNVSIKGGARVEIKGAQDLRLLPTIVNEEVKRQQGLIAIKSEWMKRKCVVGVPVHVDEVLRSCESKVVRAALDADGIVLAVKVSGAAGLLGVEVQSGRRFGTELAGYAKVASGVKGLFHSDELPKYGVSAQEVASVRKALGASAKDAFVLIAAPAGQASRAMESVRERLALTGSGVIKEVRAARADGTSEYLRPLPGAARMYPETDVPAFRVDAKMFASLELPELVTARVARYVALGLSEDLAAHAARSEQWLLIDRLVESCRNLKPAYVAETILGVAKSVEAELGRQKDVADEDLEFVLHELDQGRVSKEAVPKALAREESARDVIEEYRVWSDAKVRAALVALVSMHKNVPFKALIGLAMKDLRGKASGEKIVEMLKELVKA